MKKKKTVKKNNPPAAGRTVLAAIIGAAMSANISSANPPPAFLLQTQNFRTPNGFNVLLCPEHGGGVTSVQVWVAAGSIYENEKTAGLSHFLEHLIFKGTKKFPGDEISRLVETSGGAINAGTSKEYTVYYIDTPSEAALIAAEILADAVGNAAFPSDEIEKERPVVIEEIKRHDDSPTSVLYELLSETLYRDSPYRGRVIGDEKVIAGVSREEIIAYYKKYYTPSNITVTIAGDFDAADMRAAVEKFFGAQEPAAKPQAVNLKETGKPQTKLRKVSKSVAHTYAAAGYLAPDTSSDKQFAADVAAHVLGGGQSSRLYKKLREETRLVYAVGADFYAQKGDGIFGVSAIFDRENFDAVRQAAAAEISRLRAEGPSEEELARARAVIKNGWLFGTEKAHDRASMLGYWSVADNIGILRRYLDGINAVTSDDVKKFMEEFITDEAAVWAAVEPETKK